MSYNILVLDDEKEIADLVELSLTILITIFINLQIVKKPLSA